MWAVTAGVMVILTLMWLPALGGAVDRAPLPVMTVLSPLNSGLYDKAGSVSLVVQVTGVDPRLHGTHEIIVRLHMEHEGWRDVLTWPLRQADAWRSAATSPRPLEFRSVLVDIPSGRNTLEVKLRAPPPDVATHVSRRHAAKLNSPSFDASTQVQFTVRAVPPLLPKAGWNTTTCTLLLDTSKVGAIHKEKHLVGFVEGPGQSPVDFENLPVRHCFLYRVVDVAIPETGRDSKYNQHQGSALLTGVGPIDGDSPQTFSRYAEEIDIPILVNRLCFARREKMDLLFLAGTSSTQLGQSAMALKAKGVLAALREYATVVWVDMDGVTSLVPRPDTRTCIPFTKCWPPSAEVILPRAPVYPYNPSSALMVFRRSSQAFAFLAATIHAPSRTSSDEEVVLADAVLSVWQQQQRVAYLGQCSRPSATVACWADSLEHDDTKSPRNDHGGDSGGSKSSSAEIEAILKKQWSEPVAGIQLAKQWCDVEPETNISLVCPCSVGAVSSMPDGAQLSGLADVPGWCGRDSDRGFTAVQQRQMAGPAGRSRTAMSTGVKGKDVCDVQKCTDKEVIFVKFGPGVHFLARGPEIHYNNVWSCKLEQGSARNVPKYSQATGLKQSSGQTLSVRMEQRTRQSAASVGGKESDTCQAEECRKTCTHSQDDSTCMPNMHEAKELAPPV